MHHWFVSVQILVVDGRVLGGLALEAMVPFITGGWFGAAWTTVRPLLLRFISVILILDFPLMLMLMLNLVSQVVAGDI